MHTAKVEYRSGREVLEAYWGFLSSGGLVLSDGDFLGAEGAAELAEAAIACGPVEGEPVMVDVNIRTLRKHYRIAGHVRHRSQGRSVVAFDAGEPQDLMLNAVWADTHGVPERRHRRWELDLPVRYTNGESEGAGRIVNVSRGGLGLVVDGKIRSGSAIHLACDEFTTGGKVRWTHLESRLIGVEFPQFNDKLVGRLLRR